MLRLRFLVSGWRHCAAVHGGSKNRDIKPDNLLLDRYGHLRLSDFGLCKPLDCSTLEESDFSSGQNANGSAQNDESAPPKRTQQEQLENWQKNRRTLVTSLLFCIGPFFSFLRRQEQK